MSRSFLFYFNRFTQTPHPLNDQNPISITKVFCWCPLNIFFLNLKRILTKIDISCVKWWRQTVRLLDPSTHLCQFGANCGKIQYVSHCYKTNRSSFWLILRLSHALDGLFNVLSRLHVVHLLQNEASLNVIWLLSDSAIVAWDSF